MDSISGPEAPGKETKSLVPVVGSPGQKGPVGRYGRIWDANTKMDIKVTLHYTGNQWESVLNIVWFQGW